MKRVTVLIAGLFLAVGLAACNDEKAPVSDDATPTNSAESSDPATEETPSLDPSSGADDGEKGEANMTTLTGTVTSGVEMGCLLLEYNGTTYNLIGGDTALLKAGAEVEVTGTVSEGLMTTCQQGTPFKVDSAKAV